MVADKGFSCTVRNIIHNKNNFTVATVYVDECKVAGEVLKPRSRVKIVGNNMSEITEGDFIGVHDYQEEPDAKYGEQVKVLSWSKEIPKTEKGIIAVLGEIEGVGTVTAQRVVDYFGSDFDGLELAEYIREQGVDVLLDIDGVSPKAADAIYKHLIERKKWKDLVIQLSGLGLTYNQVLKAHEKWGYGAVEKVSQNPYYLTSLDGIAFDTADVIAKKYFNIPHDSVLRVGSAIEYVLEKSLFDDGHCWVYLGYVIERVINVARVNKDAVIRALKDVQDKGKLYMDEEYRVALPFVIDKENALASKLIELYVAECEDDIDEGSIDGYITAFEQENELVLNDKQKEAIHGVFNNNLRVLTGGPGTGKTLTIKGVVEVARSLGISEYEIALMAPTGKAARGMAEKVGIEAATVHRSLKMSPDSPPAFDQDNPLPFKLVVVDEFSMVDLFIANMLFNAIAPGTKVLLVGDKDQLPSVGPGVILRDIVGVVPTTYLDLIYRQDEASMIAYNAHVVNSGQMIDLTQDSSDFLFWQTLNENYALDVLKYYFLEGVSRYGVLETQVLAPVKKYYLGVRNLNQVLQETYNPANQKKDELRRNDDLILRQGDKVMQTRNNYDKLVFNGEIGIIKEFDVNDEGWNVLKIDFLGEEYEYEGKEVYELDLAYASTVHKAQGSEYSMVISLFHDSFYDKMLARKILYTALSRAKVTCVLLGSQMAIQKCVYNDKIGERNTMLQAKLQEGLIKLEREKAAKAKGTAGTA